MMKAIDKATVSIHLANMGGGVFEVFTIPFLLEETSFYKVAALLEEKKEEILDLYYLLGEIESYISIASYKEEIKGKYTKPIFIDKINIDIVDGIHPLVKMLFQIQLNLIKRYCFNRNKYVRKIYFFKNDRVKYDICSNI